MTPETAMLLTISAVAAVVVLYLVWSDRHQQDESERKRDQQNLLLEIQRDLFRQQTAILARCTELQRHLADHHRILKYLSRRLS